MIILPSNKSATTSPRAIPKSSAEAGHRENAPEEAATFACAITAYILRFPREMASSLEKPV